MKIITLAHQKGGVGKTTIAFNVAQAFSNNYKVAILDVDPQGSAKILKHGKVDQIQFDGDFHALNGLNYDLLIIDTPPYLIDDLSRYFAISDLVLVPFTPGILEVTAIHATIKKVKETRQLIPDLKAYVLFNRVKHHSSLINEVKEVAKDFDLPTMETVISDRVSYVRSLLKLGVFNSQDKKAQNEILALCKEIIKIVN